jgi:hypothetical protein
MKYFNIKWFAVLSALFMLASCEETLPTREPSPEANPGSSKVYFPAQEHSKILPLDATSVEVSIAREVTNAAVTVNLHLSGSAELFTIPQSINFASGEAEKTFTVQLGNIELMKSYVISIIIESDQTVPYVINEANPAVPVLALNILKEDYAPAGTGKWTDGIVAAPFGLSALTYDVEMEYSPSTEVYRLINPYGAGVYAYTEEANVVRDPAYLLIDTKDPENVTISSGTRVSVGFGIGIDYGYGEIFFSQVDYGQMVDKTITFPGGASLQVGMAEYQGGALRWWGGTCRLVLP